MGGGTSNLYPSAKGAKPYQISLIPNQIHIRHRGPVYAMNSTGSIAGGEGIISTKNRTRLLTPPDVLKECLHWRIGSISSGDLIRWIQNKLNDKRYLMRPPELRVVLKDYLPKLKSTKPAGKGYDIQAFLALVEQLEATLEVM